MMLFLFLVALPVFLLFLLKKNGKVDRLPGPSGFPFIGNLHQLYNSALHQYLKELSHKYGPLMSIRFGFVRLLVVSSAKIAKEALKTHDEEFSGRPATLAQQKLSYNNLDIALSPYNDYWREMRKIGVLHLFSSKRVQFSRFIREDEVSQMMEKISSFAASSKLINLSEIIMLLTSSIICRLAFGKRYDEEGSDQRSRFHSILREAQAMLGGFFVADYLPLMGWVDRLTGMHTRLEKNFKDMDLFYQELIDEHLNPNRPKSMHGDIIDILLQLRNEHLTSIDLTMDHIKAVLMNIFIAGTDTAASTIIWAMTAMMKNPTVLKKVQEEVRNLVGKKGMVDEDDIINLPYLKAVIKETLRLHPPAPLLMRETTQRCVIDGYEIRPRTLVYINAWAIARDPEFWENPEEFLPERFLDSAIDYRGKNFEYIPFGAGRRGCPGINLGVATVDLALANLLFAFDWELPSGMKKEDVDTYALPGFTMHKKNSLCLLARNY